MVRRTGRTKACQTCRTRKIKCDENYPICTQCAQVGSYCPGSVRGNVFLAVDPGKLGRRKGTSSPSHAETPKKKTGRVRDAGGGQRMIIYTPDTGIIVGKQLLGKFLTFMTEGRGMTTWPIRLLDMIDLHSSWRSSTWAASLIFNGQVSGHRPCLVEYRKYYGDGLQHQRLFMQRIGNSTATPTLDDVVNTMVLAYTEGMLVTTPNAAQCHLTMAVDLLGRIGPQSCQGGLAWTLFCDLRTVHALVALSQWKPSLLASNRWMTVPFEGKTKKSLDLISDFLLLLPVLCSSRQNTSVAWLVENLQHIWDTIVAENPDLPLNTATSPCGNRPADPWRLVPPAMQYSNFSTLISVVFYSLSWIMVLAKVSPQTDELDRLLLETHCDLVIYCATDQSIPTGVGYIWITLALRAVSATSPNRMQSEAAQSVIQDWGLRTALSDVLRNDLFGSFPLP